MNDQPRAVSSKRVQVQLESKKVPTVAGASPSKIIRISTMSAPRMHNKTSSFGTLRKTKMFSPISRYKTSVKTSS